MPEDGSMMSNVAGKIKEAHNILIALSSDPSVDELSAAIGLSLFLEKLDKRVTTIYSGTTPNALEFLKPEKTFESTVDVLQDFVIALNKEKADHLRYKLDGDFVKIYITPYKTRIVEEDLDFSYGDFNVDLVLALDVANGIDLDEALREHGRIMHDAVIVNITTGNPGKLGEIEWSDKAASSVSEMVSELIYSLDSKVKVEKDEATAFLTGIVAATNRFSNAKTTPDSMRIASKLLESGANQQLISKNITLDTENEVFNPGDEPKKETDDTLEINHGEEGEEEKLEETPEKPEAPAETEEPGNDLLDDLKAAEASLAKTGTEAVPEPEEKPVKIETPPETNPIGAAPIESVLPEVNISEPTTPEPASSEGFIGDKEEKVVEPSETPASDFVSNDQSDNKYGKMLEDALSSAETTPAVNPAAESAPAVPTNPEINGVPEINYLPLPDEETLPPPPAPPIDMSTPAPEVNPPVAEETPAPVTTIPQVVEPIAPATPPVEPTPTPLGQQPAMQDQVYNPQAADPGAFKIPGM